MKITISGLLFFFIIQTQLFSQPFYLKVQGGYGIGSAPAKLISYENDEVAGTYSRESEDYSLGKGAYYGLILGYYINDNMAIDLELNYHTSSAFNSYDNMKNGQYQSRSNIEISGTAFSVIPSLLLKTEFLPVNPYLKLGAILSFPGLTEKYTSHVSQQGQSSTQYMEYTYTGGLTFGVASAIGLMYEVSDGINISLELNNKNISYSPEEGKMEKATYNGVTILEQISPGYVEFEFAEATEWQSGSNDPGPRAAVQYPFSSLSFLMGVSISF